MLLVPKPNPYQKFRFDIPLQAVYDWHDIVLYYNSTQSLEGLVRRLCRQFETPIHISVVQRDFKIVRQFWRDRIEDGTYVTYVRNSFMTAKDINKFLQPRKKLMTYGANRPKD